MNNQKRAIFALICLMLISNVYALQLITSESSTSLCPRDTHLFTDSVRNDGLQEQEFSVKVEGNSKEWTAFIPTSFLLAPGEERAIYTYLTPASNTFPAKYVLDVRVSTNNSSQIAHHSIFIKDCKPIIKQEVVKVQTSVRVPVAKISVVNPQIVNSYYNFSVLLLKKSVELCGQSRKAIPITIVNTGDPDSYELSADGPLWAYLDHDKLNLNKELNQFNLVLIPDNSVSGNFSIKINIIPENGSIKAAHIIKAVVKKCNSVSVDILYSKDNVCNSETAAYDFIVKNTGISQNTFNLELDASKWVKLETDKITLQPKTEKKLKLIINPDTNIDDYNIVVKAADSSGVSAEDSIKIKTFESKDCYKAKIKPEKSNSSNIPITIENNGIHRANYYISSSEDFVKLTSNVITIDPENSDVIYASISREGSAVISVKLKDGTLLASTKISVKTSIFKKLKNTITSFVPSEDIEIGESDNETQNNTITGNFAAKYLNKTTFYNTIKKIDSYKIHIFIALLIILIIVIIIRQKLYKKVFDFFEEDEEGKNEIEIIKD